MYPDPHVSHPLAHPVNRTEAPTEKPHKPYSFGRILGLTVLRAYLISAVLAGLVLLAAYIVTEPECANDAAGPLCRIAELDRFIAEGLAK